jgi:hypothetical protein
MMFVLQLFLAWVMCKRSQTAVKQSLLNHNMAKSLTVIENSIHLL